MFVFPFLFFFCVCVDFFIQNVFFLFFLSFISLCQGYIQAVAEAAHAIGALVVLDGIASGCIWTPMIDVLFSFFFDENEKMRES